jgi:AhpD family alkylhydroperoxidase
MTSAATRKSIKEFFPLGIVMSRGSDNPITLHDTGKNEKIFSSVWALIGEIMVAVVPCQGDEIEQATREEIASVVSKKNSCPVCITAHAMMVSAARKSVMERRAAAKDADADASSVTSSVNTVGSNGQQKEAQAIAYAEIVHAATSNRMDLPTDDEAVEDFPLLNAKAKAEIALVVLLFEHMNRVVSVIMGAEMSTAMFSIPRSVARGMESSRVMGVVNKMMAPFLSRSYSNCPEPGFTIPLFKAESNYSPCSLPEHLQDTETAGVERARALARVYALVGTLYKESPLKDIFSDPALLTLLDAETATPPPYQSEITSYAVQKRLLEEKLTSIPDGKDKTVAMAILMSSVSPARLYQSPQWVALVDAVGKKEARLVIIWWSLRLTLKRAKGLLKAKGTMQVQQTIS